jgi:alkylated DNA repair dioxygenase AlkB
MTPQLNLFGSRRELPEGFRYRENLIAPRDEQRLLGEIRGLPFKAFEFQGFTGKRRTISFGWRYDFNEHRLLTAEDIPPFLLELRESAAALSQRSAEEFEQALVIEYDAGATIGWHRDRSVFGEVIGISLLTPCLFRLRRKVADKWERVSLTAEPRSAYLLSGPARTEWEHSIPPVESLRYSVTFRTLLRGRGSTARQEKELPPLTSR